VNAGSLFYYLRKKGLYLPRDGWIYFAARLAFANAILAVWISLGAGDLQAWLHEPASWRLTHLFGLLLSAVVVYFAALWVSGIRVQHLSIPQVLAAKS
jgi:putative peptidoglycan lipid II flippase